MQSKRLKSREIPRKKKNGFLQAGQVKDLPSWGKGKNHTDVSIARQPEKIPALRNLPAYDKSFVALTEPDSIAAEQYKVLRTRILRAGNTKRVILVSSAAPREGKTVTAINLAISIAQGLHETTLLIDADLRNPTLSRLFGIEGGEGRGGLSGYLTSGGDLAHFLVKTPVPKVSLLPAGPPSPNPSELLGSKRMSDLIQEVKSRYDNRYIIIDSPPLIPITDSVILSSLADAVILVAKASVTPRDIIDEAILRVEDNDKIMGLVLTNFKDLRLKRYQNYGKDVKGSQDLPGGPDEDKK
ncbi:MAG: polysaccharide biosynthesis tyrosine autokinase [bacterium]